jgi:DNA gyrase subunit B
VLHSGGKFDNKVYKTSGGLHGVGVTAVNALSSILKVWSKREGQTEFLEFQEGILVKSEITTTPEVRNGTNITFTPDQKVFREFTHFRSETIQNRLQELAYLNPKLTLFFFSNPEAEPTVYHYESGLAGWVQALNQEKVLENTEICAEE